MNGFPFLYPDSCTYLEAGFAGRISELRPATYGLFIRHVSLAESLWLVVFVQALMVSWTVHAFFRCFSTTPVTWAPFATVVVVSLTTNVGLSVGMLMPDFLAAVMVIASAILLFADRPGRAISVTCAFFVLFATASHHSHAFVLGVSLSGAWLLGTVWPKLQHRPVSLPLRRPLLVLAMMVSGYFTIPIVHHSISGNLVWSGARSIFLTNRMHQHGLLVPFLRRHCATGDYFLCAEKDQLPDDLLWHPDSPLVRNGGFVANDPACARIMNDFFSEPRSLFLAGVRTVEGAVVQFFTFEGPLIFPEGHNPWSVWSIDTHLPQLSIALRRSMQHTGNWSSAMQDLFQRLFVYGTMALMAIAFIFRSPHLSIPRVQKHLASFLVLCLAANALVCSGISMVDMRFQNRVIWLLPMFAAWLFFEWRYRDPFGSPRPNDG